MYVVYINLLYFLSIFLFTYNKNLLSQKKNIIIRNKNKRGWPSEFDNLCTKIQSCSNTISHILRYYIL